MQQAGKHPQRGRLAGAVRPEKAIDLAGAHAKVEVADCQHAGPISLGQAVGLHRQSLCHAHLLAFRISCVEHNEVDHPSQRERRSHCMPLVDRAFYRP